MKSIKLNIDLDKAKAGDVVELENNIARHFIAKGWGVETEETPVISQVPEVKKERHVVSRKIPKK